MPDGNWVSVTMHLLHVSLHVCRTVTAFCRSTSNRRGTWLSPDFRRFLEAVGKRRSRSEQSSSEGVCLAVSCAGVPRPKQGETVSRARFV